MKIILSLFDLTGNWSRPYRENGFEVIQVDIQKGIDILNWDYKKIPVNSVYGILAACPCTDFAQSGSRWWKQKDFDGRTNKSIQLVHKTLEIISYFKPKFWVIENPVGRISKLVPEVGEVKLRFNPCDYAGYLSGEEREDNRYNKRTCLYGCFNIPEKQRLEPLPELYRKIWEPTRSDGTKISWNSLECKNSRSATPLGFSYAFYEFNHI